MASRQHVDGLDVHRTRPLAGDDDHRHGPVGFQAIVVDAQRRRNHAAGTVVIHAQCAVLQERARIAIGVSALGHGDGTQHVGEAFVTQPVVPLVALRIKRVVLAWNEKPEWCGIDVAWRFRLTVDQPPVFFFENALAATETHAGAGVEGAIEYDARCESRFDGRRCLGDRATAIDTAKLGFAVVFQRRQAERVYDGRLGGVVPRVTNQSVDIVGLQPRIGQRFEDCLER